MQPVTALGTLALWARMYRLLLRIYPSAFRRRFETEMAQLFRDGYRRQSRRRGASKAASWLLSSLADLLWNGLAERIDWLRRSVGSLRSGKPDLLIPPGRKGSVPMLNRIQDLRFAIRSLGRQPVFTLVVILTVALGVGANTAMFSVISGVLLTPLPHSDPDRLVLVFETDRINGTQREGASGPDYFDWLEQQTVFQSMGAWTSFSPTATGAVEEPERLQATRFAHSLFTTLGWQAALGRVYSAQEDQPGGENVAVISQGLWQRQFGGDSGAIGRMLTLDGVEHQIIGVMPSSFSFPTPQTDVWLPLQLGPTSSSRGQHGLLVAARLADGVSIQAAQTEMTQIMARLEEAYPEDNVGRGANLQFLEEAVVGQVRPALWILMAAVGMVLLIACVNVANLLLSRAGSRRQELAIRASLGAGRVRILWQLLTESLLLSLLGGLLGLGVALAGVRLLRTLGPSSLPRLDQVEFDLPVLVFALLAALATGLAFGILPAWQATRLNLTDSLKQGGRSASAGGHNRLRRILAVGEVALAFVLVAAAGLLIQSMWRLNRVEAGFEPRQLVTLTVNLPTSRYPNNFREWPNVARVQQFHREILQEMGRIPSLESAALAVQGPTQSGWTTRIMLEGGPTTPEEGVEEERLRPVSREYFSTLKVPLLQGRTFDMTDRADSASVVMVNRAFARKYFPEEDSAGKRLIFWGQTREIVGVVEDVKFMGLDREIRPAVYTLLDQMPFSQFSILLRSSQDSAQILRAAASVVRQMDPDLAVFNPSAVEDLLSASLAQRRFNAILLGLFAGLALLLAVVGIYGVISYGVSQRTHEFGVRMSLGAGRSSVIRLVLIQSLKLSGMGLLLGLLGSLAATRLLSGLLFEVQATDPVNLLAVALFLGAVALLACLTPARRASRVDPLIALRCQ